MTIRPRAQLDLLEQRTLLATQILFDDFASTTGLTGNGFSGAITAANRLRMTDGSNNEARSAWFNTAVPIDTFRTDFTFKSTPGNSADGLCFVVQNGATSALGTAGLDLGYAGINNSEAVCFNLFNFATYGSQFGFASNGATPPTNSAMAPIDLHNGDRFGCTIIYDGTNLNVAVSDASNRSLIFNASTPIDLATAIGSHTAIVGFTAATGFDVSVQDVFSWSFSGAPEVPTVATPSSASPNPIDAGTTADLSVLGGDSGGESSLTYTWSVVKSPTGAKPPVFSTNGDNGAKNTTATFYKAGQYRFRCTITNPLGGSVSSDVVVNVEQAGTQMGLNPHAVHVGLGKTVQYIATVYDQFRHPIRTQPDIGFSIQSGDAGTIDPISGLFTASSTTRGHVVVAATAEDLTGLVGVGVTL